MDLGLRGLKAVLAGASKGIGGATAEALAAEGADVALCARGAAGVDAAVASLRAKGVKAIGESIDMADGAAYRSWVERAATELGGCDIFISFASAGGGPPTEENWKATFDLDVMATYRGIEAAMPFLEKSEAGSVVAISSSAAVEDFFGPQSYTAMKASVISYASALSRQLASKNIRVNTVSPGPIFVEGGAWDNIKTHMRPFYDQAFAAIPMGRMGNPEEVARAITFIASPACRFMTGTNVVIDGALTKRAQF